MNYWDLYGKWQDKWEEYQDCTQRAFEFGVCHGADAAASEYVFWHNRKVELTTLAREQRIALTEEELEEFFAEKDNLDKQIAKDRLAGIPDRCMGENYRELEQFWGHIARLEQRLARMRDDADRLERIRTEGPESFEAEQDWSFHWSEAKKIWQRRLDWLITKGATGMSLATGKKLFGSLERELERKTISSWYYFAIGLELCRIMNKLKPHPVWEKETQRFLSFGESCAKYAAMHDRRWGPPPPHPAPEPMDPEMELGCKPLSEDELIHAIDKRRRYMDKYRRAS